MPITRKQKNPIREAISNFGNPGLNDSPAIASLKGLASGVGTGVMDTFFPEEVPIPEPMTALGMAASKSARKALPIIAPEAYEHVKANGLRLYSRLTDTFAKAPKQLVPGKIRSLAAQGASKEEFDLRKLEQFLDGKPEMQKIPREDVMNHLKSNPLELDVVRKGQRNDNREIPFSPREQADQELLLMRHELDTEYGGQWSLENITPEQRARYNDLERRADAGDTIDNPAEWDAPSAEEAKYDWMQTPGPKENYGESLINLPTNVKPNDFTQYTEGTFPPGVDPTRADFANKENVFMSSHWDEPNNLVWSRHNDRHLETVPNTDAYPEEIGAGPKIRFGEELQSDLHQKGREHGYKGRPDTQFDLARARETGNTRTITTVDPTYPGNNNGPQHEEREWLLPTPDGGGISGWGTNFDEAVQSGSQWHEKHSPVVPDMPFKDTYHELALKQQVLDAVNDPSLDGFYIADSTTAAFNEGHPQLKAGMQFNYDERNPKALKDLLTPYGLDIEHRQMPFDVELGRSAAVPYENYSVAQYDQTKQGTKIPAGTSRVVDFRANPGQGTHTMDVLPRQDFDTTGPDIPLNGRGQMPQGLTPHEVQAKLLKPHAQARYGDPTVKSTEKAAGWGTQWSPEIKALIKERGFPAMAAFMALQSQRDRMNGGEQ